MLQIRTAQTGIDLQGILSLQSLYLKQHLPNIKSRKDGFVTVQHDLKTLQLMQSMELQMIAVQNNQVIGYALVMHRDLRDAILVLRPMFARLDQLDYAGEALASARYYIMGQICIHQEFRGQGIFAKLYRQHKVSLSDKYDYCITEVSQSNARSLRAHARQGFEILHRYNDATDDWLLLIWDWRS